MRRSGADMAKCRHPPPMRRRFAIRYHPKPHAAIRITMPAVVDYARLNNNTFPFHAWLLALVMPIDASAAKRRRRRYFVP